MHDLQYTPISHILVNTRTPLRCASQAMEIPVVMAAAAHSDVAASEFEVAIDVDNGLHVGVELTRGPCKIAKLHNQACARRTHRIIAVRIDVALTFIICTVLQ